MATNVVGHFSQNTCMSHLRNYKAIQLYTHDRPFPLIFVCVSTSQLKIFSKTDYLMGNVDQVCVASLRRLYILQS